MTRNLFRFQPGRFSVTPGARFRLEAHGVSALNLLQQHLRLEPGSAPPEDQQANEDALVSGARIFSFFHLVAGDDASRIWVITEATNDEGERWSTTALLPGEY